MRRTRQPYVISAAELDARAALDFADRLAALLSDLDD